MKKIRTFSSRRTLIYPQSKIGLIVGKVADLPQEIIEKHEIEIISAYKADWPEVYPLPGENIYQKMREAEKRGIKTFCKTSQPSPKAFLDAYKKQLESFENVICITLTSKLSGTYNSAIQGKNFLKPEEQKRVYVVDSLSVSGGQALLAFKAFDLIEEEKTAQDIKQELEVLISKIYFRIALKDPKWVEAAGRISPTIADWIRRIQKAGVYPLLGFKKGVLKPVAIKFGVKDIVAALFKELERKTRKLRRQNKKIRAIITHGDDMESAQKLKERIEKELEGIEILFVNMVNNLIGTLAGPGALALAWVES